MDLSFYSWLHPWGSLKKHSSTEHVIPILNIYWWHTNAAPLWHAHEGGLVSAVRSDCIAAFLPSSIRNMLTRCIVRASHGIFFSMFSSTRVSRSSGLTCRLPSRGNGPTKMWHTGPRSSYHIETLQFSKETFRLLQDFKRQNCSFILYSLHIDAHSASILISHCLALSEWLLIITFDASK